MSTFRDKPHRKSSGQKNSDVDQYTSIDSFHQQKTKTFDQLENQQLPRLRDDLVSCQHRLAVVRAQPPGLDRTTEEYELERSIKLLQEQIANIESGAEFHEYWIQVTPLLTQYYRPTTNPTTTPAPATTVAVRATAPSSSIDLSNLFKENVNVEKKALFERYMSMVHEPTALDMSKTDTTAKRATDSSWIYCATCKIEKMPVQHEGMMICPTCGQGEYALMHSDRPCFKEKQQQETLSSYTYKRINHFNEWLSEFQAKELTVVPPDVLATIKAELKKHRLLDPNVIQYTDMRTILKKLKYNRYYEHIPYIMSKLTGKQAAIISKETEDLLRTMFKQLQAPFERHCPEGRSNFLSYRYVLRKMFEILSMDEYAQQFMLPKSKIKITEYDSIWGKICKDLNWPFFPTIISMGRDVPVSSMLKQPPSIHAFLTGSSKPKK